MEDLQRTEISKRFPKQYLQKRIISLNIPDIYHFNQPELIKVLRSELNDFFSFSSTNLTFEGSSINSSKRDFLFLTLH